MDKEKNRVRFLVSFVHNADDAHDYNTECMNNTATLQGQQQQRQFAVLKRQKQQQEDQDSHSPPHATYKIGSFPNIPTRNVLVESRRYVKHITL